MAAPAATRRLHRVDGDSPGISRHRAGRGFAYRHPSGRSVRDTATLERIKGLAIPPAWEDVWICPDPAGHLQASGVDEAGRRQPLYHPRWRERRDGEKFRRVEDFATRLPALRTSVAEDLGLRGFPRARILACAVRLLDQAFFRIGSEAYARRNGSFGLATLKRSHVTVGRGRVSFDYAAKSGKRRHQEVRDPEILPLIRSLLRRKGGGRELLAFKEAGVWRDVRSTDINHYLKDLAGDEYTAKDFRTWHATVLAAIELATVRDAEGAAARKREMAAAVRTVAEQLGNTPAVCRASYIDPRIFNRFAEGYTIATDLPDVDVSTDDPAMRGRVERAVLQLLGGAPHRG